MATAPPSAARRGCFASWPISATASGRLTRRRARRVAADAGSLLLRDDREFHAYEALEAGFATYHALAPTAPRAAERVLVAVARYLAARAPTSRAMLQTARSALRLRAGEDLSIAPAEE